MTKRSLLRYFKTSREIIRLPVILYVRFPLSLRNVEDLPNEVGIGLCQNKVTSFWSEERSQR
jgi:putative transposase